MLESMLFGRLNNLIKAEVITDLDTMNSIDITDDLNTVLYKHYIKTG